MTTREEKLIGVKWKRGFVYFWTGKMRFGLLGLGMKDIKMGMGKPKYHYKDCRIVGHFRMK
jgi:hypothetical protein